MPKTLTKRNPVGWFEIPTSNIQRAKKFYEDAFNFKLEAPMKMEGFEMSMFPMERGAEGAAGSLIQGNGYTPSHEGALVYFSVEDIESTEAKIKAAGGRVHKPKKSIGEYGYISLSARIPKAIASRCILCPNEFVDLILEQNHRAELDIGSFPAVLIGGGNGPP